MPHARWARLEDLFAQAVERSGSARAEYLRDACGDDTELLIELETLLRAHDESGPMDAGPVPRPVEAMTLPRASLDPGTCLGAWRISELLGRGGTGEVYAAARIDESFAQRAALKLLRADAVGQLARFHAERRILAKLEHAGIARLLDGGVAPDGRPYTVIEFVQGVSLHAYCMAQKSSLRERLDLFLQVCDAVAFAHRNLVIHRDLKSANTLVDAHGTVKLLDFGIAKLLDANAADLDADMTLAPFTPDYAAPEQLSGQQITTATDIYSLGVLLFELLTDARPLQIAGQRSLLALQLAHERAPTVPSQIAQANAAAPIQARALRGDLDAIIAKCLRKEPAHRYATVNELAVDLHRHLRHQPVQARSGARSYMLGRFVRRHWLALGATAILIVTLGGAALYAQQARQRTELALQRADAVRGFLIALFQQNDPDSGNSRSLSARDLVDIGAGWIATGFNDDSDTRIELLGVSGKLYQSLGEVQKSGDFFAQRLALAEQVYPATDPRLIEAQLDRADQALADEQFGLAEALLEKALSSTQAATFALFGFKATPKPEMLALRMNALLALGRLESARSNQAGAISWADRAIALGLSQHAISARESSRAYADRGGYIFKSGRIADAEAPLRAALARLESLSETAKIDATDQADLRARLDVRERLGMVLTSLGRFDEALPLLRANVASIRALLGDKHPALADAVHQLASALRQSGDYKAALPTFEEAYRLYEQNYGASHSYVATALTGLGQTLIALGLHAQAIAALTRAHQIYLESLGASHLYTAIAEVAVAEAKLKAGQLTEAEAGFRAALNTFSGIADGQHIYAEAARLGLGKTLVQTRQYAKAESALRQAHTRLLAEFGATDRRAMDAALTLVECLSKMGRLPAARALLDDLERAASGSKSKPELRARVLAARLQLDGQ